MDEINYFTLPGLRPFDNPLFSFNYMKNEILNALIYSTHTYTGKKYTVQQVHGKSRLRDLVIIRQVLCYTLKTLFPKVTLNYIGHSLNYKDHTIVIHGINKLKDLIEVEDPHVMHIYNYLK